MRCDRIGIAIPIVILRCVYTALSFIEIAIAIRFSLSVHSKDVSLVCGVFQCLSKVRLHGVLFYGLFYIGKGEVMTADCFC